jgi:prevent-host-death family protein
MTIKDVGVAEAKKQFSTLLGRVAYGGERIVISKRGKPMAILIPADDDPFFSIVDEVTKDRAKHKPRVLP